MTLDVVMPHKDGWQVLRDLKADEVTRRIPIVVCTISSDRDQAFELGAVAYLAKPFVEADLRQAIGQAA